MSNIRPNQPAGSQKLCAVRSLCEKAKKPLSLLPVLRATRRNPSVRFSPLGLPGPEENPERATKAYTLGLCGRGRAYQLPGPCGRVTTVGGVGVMIYDVCCRPTPKKKGEILETVDWPKVSPQKACTEPPYLSVPNLFVSGLQNAFARSVCQEGELRRDSSTGEKKNEGSYDNLWRQPTSWPRISGSPLQVRFICCIW